MSYKRKTQDEFVILGNYGYGYEELCIEINWRDLRENLKAYRENEIGVSFTYKKRRVKLND